jgi:nucleotide-binding universal stress UspA family protein
LHLFHAIVLHDDDPHNPAYHLPEPSRIRTILGKLATKRMGAMVRDHEIPEPVVKQVHRRDVSAAPSIVEYAGEADIDLIVMGTHGRRGFRKLLLGSVAAEVVRMAPCSVMTVRGKGGEVLPHPFRRILVPIDFSEPAGRAMAIGCNLASTNGAELQLVHVLHEVLHPAFYNMGVIRISDLEEDILQKTKAALGTLFAEAGDCQGTTAECFALEGNPGAEILRFSQDHGTDLIVMATQGLTGIKHLLMGSTAEKVLAGAECPVLIVRESGRTLLP